VADTSPAPQFNGDRPAVLADHLGASTYIEKGWSLISLGDYPGAIQALDKALTLSPGAVQAQSLLGWAQMLHEDYDDALGNFSKVLMKEPANALARINVGYICLKKGIFGEAIEHLSKAIRLDNDRKATLYAHYYLGLVYLEREMYEDAQTFLRKTLKLGPNLIEAYFELGRALWLGGQREEAVRIWTDGYKANKFNPWAKRCQEMLEVASAGGEVPRSPLA
jgi:tetratricopeptide (TPR) repeat protein